MNGDNTMTDDLTEYTPTTDEIRDHIVGGGDLGGWGSLTTGQEAARAAAFDRWLAAHDAEIRAERVAPDREKLIAAIADYQYCGSCAGAPENTPWCKSCQGEADALLAAGVFGVNADTIRAEALETLANEEAHWAARAWRSDQAETVSKMRKAILDRAAQYRKAAGE